MKLGHQGWRPHIPTNTHGVCRPVKLGHKGVNDSNSLYYQNILCLSILPTFVCCILFGIIKQIWHPVGFTRGINSAKEDIWGGFISVEHPTWITYLITCIMYHPADWLSIWYDISLVSRLPYSDFRRCKFNARRIFTFSPIFQSGNQTRSYIYNYPFEETWLRYAITAHTPLVCIAISNKIFEYLATIKKGVYFLLCSLYHL